MDEEVVAEGNSQSDPILFPHGKMWNVDRIDIHHDDCEHPDMPTQFKWNDLLDTMKKSEIDSYIYLCIPGNT